MSDFDGLVAIVTGGASGIGRAVAERLLTHGARVGVLDREPDGSPEGSLAVSCDVTDRESVTAAVSSVTASYGRLDIVINNAGIGAIGTVADNDDEEWARVLDINVVGMARVAASALPWLQQSPVAAIVNTASVAAKNGIQQRALYSASKGAVLALTLAMAADHLRDGIRVNCVCPGTAATPWIGRLLAQADDPEAEASALAARQPIGRLVTADEIATAIVYLANPSASSTTGTVLDVDGGFTTLRVRPTT